MKAILISGLFPTADSNGLSSISNDLIKMGHTPEIHKWDEKNLVKNIAALTEHLIVIGFSLGGMQAVQIALQKVGAPIVYLGLIDAVHKDWCPMFLWFIPLPIFFGNAAKYWTIPRSVERADSFQRKNPVAYPAPSSAILNPSNVYINQSPVDSAHENMPRQYFVTSTMLKTIGGIS